MARIAGVELADQWRVNYALTRLKGIGWALSRNILKELEIDETKRVASLSPDEIAKIANKLEDFPIEGELARKVKADIQRLKVIGSYRGLRHSRGLPVRGQRTRHNARQKRGKRKTVGAYRKEALAKLKKQDTKAKESQK